MALIGNISGSSGNNSRIGISGSIIVANRPNGSFPGLPGTNVTFFVSGSANTGSDVSVFGGDVVVSGSLTADNIKSPDGTTAITLQGSNVIIPGDLTVNGDTTTINTTNLEVRDAVIGLGFSSGTIALSAGDRGLIGGRSATSNVAFLWKNVENEFAFGTTASSATGSLPVSLSGYSNIHAANVQASIVTASLGFSGSLTKLADGTSYLIAGTNIAVTSASNGAVTISAAAAAVDDFFDSTTNGSIFTTGSAAFRGGESAIDSPSDKGTDVFFYVSGSQESRNGATPGVALFGGDVIVSGSFVGFGDTLELTGTLHVTNGISGSLTQLTDGSSYLVAGTNITIASQSNGSILISSVDTQGDDFFDSTTAGSIFTSGSAAFRGSESSVDSPADKGTDVFFYVSGSQGSKDGGTPGVALFGGDVVISGTLHGGSPLKVSGSMQVSGSFSQGTNSQATGIDSHAEGEGSAAMGSYSHAEGYYTTATGSYSHAEGEYAKAYGIGSHAEGSLTVAGCLGYIGSISAGLITLDSSYGDVSAEIFDYVIVNDQDYSNTYTHKVFEIASVVFNSPSTEITLVDSSVTTATAIIGVETYTEPTLANYVIGNASHAEGGGSIAQGLRSHAESGGVASGHHSHAESEGTASGYAAHAEGLGKARGFISHAEGWNTEAYGQASHAEGFLAWAGGDYSHAGGEGTIASGSAQTIVGKYNLRDNDFSLFVVGNGTGQDNVDRSDVFRINQNRVEVTGSFTATAGLSGSLTKLADGTSYLVGGTNISITSASNGSVTIDNTFVQVDDFFDSTTAGSIFTTGSAAFRGGESAVDSPSDKGTDVFFYVSGSLNGTNRSLFGGDVVVSGSVDVKNNVTLGDTTSDTVAFNGRINTDVLPSADNSYNLGSESNRWANVYTGDLHLKNDRGNWTLIEEEEYLTLRNNNTGKVYRLVMEPVE